MVTQTASIFLRGSVRGISQPIVSSLAQRGYSIAQIDMFLKATWGASYGHVALRSDVNAYRWQAIQRGEYPGQQRGAKIEFAPPELSRYRESHNFRYVVRIDLLDPRTSNISEKNVSIVSAHPLDDIEIINQAGAYTSAFYLSAVGRGGTVVESLTITERWRYNPNVFTQEEIE